MPAVKSNVVRTLEAFISHVERLRRYRKGPLWFRGCGKVGHQLIPSLYRHKGSRTIEDFMALEKLLIERFRQRSIPFQSRPLADYGNGYS
jgi:hypothetical protein